MENRKNSLKRIVNSEYSVDFKYSIKFLILPRFEFLNSNFTLKITECLLILQVSQVLCSTQVPYKFRVSRFERKSSKKSKGENRILVKVTRLCNTEKSLPKSENESPLSPDSPPLFSTEFLYVVNFEYRIRFPIQPRYGLKIWLFSLRNGRFDLAEKIKQRIKIRVL